MQLRPHDLPFGNRQVGKTVLVCLTLLAFFTYQKGNPELPGQSLPAQPVNAAVTGLTQKYRFVSSMLLRTAVGKGKPFLNHSRLLDWVAGGLVLLVELLHLGAHPAVSATRGAPTPTL